MRGPSRKVVLVGVIMAMVITLSLLSASARIKSGRSVHPRETMLRNELPQLYPLIDFELVDSSGEPFSLDSMTGKIWVADFIFTSCSGPCPVMTSRMSDVYRAFEGDDRVDFLSISVNPEVDTPEVLSEYAERYDADTSRWHFVTGEKAEIQRVAVEGFKLGSVDDPIIHSDRFALVDAEGFVRGYYEGTTQAGSVQLTRDLVRLLN